VHRAPRIVTALSLAALVAGAAPVQAKSPHSEHRGGKKPIGEVVSFDAATSALVLELAGGEELTATVDEDARVKLEHRGSQRRNKGHGNPSNGSLEDLAAGALVLRMKIEDEEITKIRLRPAPAPAEETPPAEGDQSQDGTGGDDDVAADPADSDSDDSDDSDDDQTDEGEDADTPDDGESGDE
jgi:hypothetical protein